MDTNSVNPENTPQVAQASQSVQTPAAAQASAQPKTVAEKLAEVRGQKPQEAVVPASASTPVSTVRDPETTGQGVKEVKKDEQKPFKRERDNNRFSELTKKLKEKDALIASLQKQMQSIAPPKARDEYATDEEYIAETAKHAASKNILESQMSSAEAERRAEERQAWDERVQATVKDAKSFEERIRRHVSDIDRDTEEYVMASPHGARMLEIILEKFEEPGAKEVFLSMPRAKRSALLVALENAAAAPAETPAQVQQVAQQHAPLPSLAPERGNKLPAAPSPSSAVQAKLNSIRHKAGMR